MVHMSRDLGILRHSCRPNRRVQNGAVSERQCPSPCGSVTITDFSPIHHVPPCLEVVGAAVLAVKIISGLPDVGPEQNALAGHPRAVLVGPRFDSKLAIPRTGGQHPSRAAHAPTGRPEVAPPPFP